MLGGNNMGRKQASNDDAVQRNRNRALQYYYDHRDEILKRQKETYVENKANRARIAELEAEIERLRGELENGK